MGLQRAQKLNKRVSALLDLKKLLLWLHTEILFSAKTVEMLICENPSSRFCSLARETAIFSKNPITALRQAGDRLLQDEKDKRMFADFVSGLGTSDTENQIRHIKLYEELAAQHLAEASEDSKRRSKLCVALGLFGGVTLSLLMI